MITTLLRFASTTVRRLSDWLVGRPRSSTPPPPAAPVTARPLRVVTFVYPTLISRGWNLESIERSNALDSTKPSKEMRAWLANVDKVKT